MQEEPRFLQAWPTFSFVYKAITTFWVVTNILIGFCSNTKDTMADEERNSVKE